MHEIIKRTCLMFAGVKFTMVALSNIIFSSMEYFAIEMESPERGRENVGSECKGTQLCSGKMPLDMSFILYIPLSFPSLLYLSFS